MDNVIKRFKQIFHFYCVSSFEKGLATYCVALLNLKFLTAALVPKKNYSRLFKNMGTYYNANYLKSNPRKTQVCSCYLWCKKTENHVQQTLTKEQWKSWVSWNGSRENADLQTTSFNNLAPGYRRRLLIRNSQHSCRFLRTTDNDLKFPLQKLIVGKKDILPKSKIME